MVKSGLMVGLGETVVEIQQTLMDLRQAGVEVVTIGQYLQPSRKALPVVEYIQPPVFDQLAEQGKSLGFKHVESGPLVRSSYLADTLNI